MAPVSTKTWSPYQEAIFANIRDDKAGHTSVVARAGVGKTTVLIEGLKHIPRGKKTLLVAFNKKIAEELQERAPNYSYLEICTMHSFGYRMIREALGAVKLDKDKEFGIIKNLLQAKKKTPKERDDYDTIFSIKKAVALCKGSLVDSPEDVDELMDEYELSTGALERDEFIGEVIQVLGDCKRDLKKISFDDMIWLPYVLHLPIEQYDRVWIDEFQDLNRSQHYLSMSACKKDGRMLIVGDEFQTLYGFRSAVQGGMEEFRKKHDAVSLPLPISYRCPRAVIKEAQKYVPDIQHTDTAKDGQVINIAEKELIHFVKPNDFVISRTNAPLIKLCYQFWRNKIPAAMRGKDLGPVLLSVVSQSKKKTIKAFLEWLHKWANAEVLRLKGKNRSTGSIEDKVDCLEFLCEGKTHVQELTDAIKELCQGKDEDGVVELGTIHFFKGKEANRVFFLTKTMFMGYEKQEEKNCAYVAISRARETLFYVR